MISLGELAIIALVLFLVLPPQQLRALLRWLGRQTATANRHISTIKTEWDKHWHD